MEQTVTDVLLALLRLEINGVGAAEDSFAELLDSPDTRKALYQLAKKHDMAHLLCAALERCSLLPKDDEVTAKLQKQQMLAVYRYQRFQYELQQLCCLLEEAAIAFIPLKGSVLRRFYPEPWMRTSCDIDILVKPTDLERAISLLVEKHGYTNKGRDYHDVSLFSPSGVHLELHFDLVEEEYANRVGELLACVWDHVSPVDGCTYHMEMTDEMFYCYHVAHMAKHIEFGGCGIRPFLDLWILDHRVPHDRQARDAMLARGNLLTFANAARELSEIWFSGNAHHEWSKRLQDYVLEGGVYGTMNNRIAVQQKRSGGGFAYVLSRIFLSYESLRSLYPILNKHRWLTPFMQVRRWFRLLFGGRMRSSMRELKINQEISDSQRQSTADLMDRLGL